MKKVKIKIKNQEIVCNEGESILNAARANGIFIPAICYLSCSSPTVACKMCMVEADGKRVYACNAKVKDGMEVVVHTKEIDDERKAIMQAYDVNHPLQCGVCDKSGDCELQNYTHFVEVASQEYAIKDDYKALNSWGKTVYDPNLCIVCERCVTLCKDKIGKSYIKTIKRDGDMPSGAYKDSMPKDAYSVWTRFRKFLIGPSGDGDCGDCGECSSVCPVGALSIGHFQYTSNVWELTKIPSSCAHCANACEIIYEVKQEGIGGDKKQVYRIKSDWNFATLCPAGRLAFDVNNQDVKKDKEAFNATIAAFKEAKGISFAGNVSNEEAYLLQKMKEKFGYKLVCKEVYDFSLFLKEFSKVSGNLGSGSQKNITKSDVVICFGGALSYDMPVITHNINNAMKQNKGAILAYFHTMQDKVINHFIKATSLINGSYKMGSEEAFTLLLADVLIANKPQILKEQIEKYAIFVEKEVEKEIKKIIKMPLLDENGSAVLDENGQEKFEEKEAIEKIKDRISVPSSQLLEYCGITQEILESFKGTINADKKISLIIGFDVYRAKNAKNIAKILGFIEALSNVEITLLPPSTNALGIALLCDLDKDMQGYSIGYNAKGSYKIGSGDENALKMPYLSEQEGTLVNADKRVVPLSPATPYFGYELNDIAIALGFEEQDLVDYTEELPLNKGFKSIKYDDLGYGFANNGDEIRGYLLDTKCVKEEVALDFVDLKALPSANLYARNPVSHFNTITLQSKLLDSKNGLQLTKKLAKEWNLNAGDKVEITFSNGKIYRSEVVIDDDFEGDFGALGVCDMDEFEYFSYGRYDNATIKAL